MLLLVVLLSMNGGVRNLSVAQTTGELVRRFLPKTAKVETLRTFDPITKTETNALAAKTGRMNGKGGRYLALIYSTTDSKESGHLRLRVVQNPEGRTSILDQNLPGTFLWMQDFKTNGFQVLDLNGDGNDEIVTITAEGASLGAYLNVFALRQGKLVSILSKPKGYEIDGYGFMFKPSPGGKYRIIISGKDNSSVQMYSWDGKEFKRTS